MTSAASVMVSTSRCHRERRGPIPTAALHSMVLKPIPFSVAKAVIVRNHYLHSLPGGTKLTFGVFVGERLSGAIVFGAGPQLAYSLVEGASRDNCLALTRLWLSDELGANSESRIIGIALRAIKKNTALKFLVSYADPSQGHMGTIYQATGWLYTGLSEATPLYDLGDGKARHSRSIGHCYGTHSTKHFANNGVPVKLIPQSAKHRYVHFLDQGWRQRLKPPVLPYPKKQIGEIKKGPGGGGCGVGAVITTPASP